MAQPSPSFLRGPSYHYYLEPYSILSFVAGLYLDSAWSDAEFDKWKKAGAVKVKLDDGTEEWKYLYEEYLKPYRKLMPSRVAKVISNEVAKNQPDERDRRAPTSANCDEVWEPLLDELMKPAGKPSGGQPPEFFAQKPVLSTLAAIYLGTPQAVASALEHWQSDAGTLQKFQAVLAAKGTIGVRAPLEALKQKIYFDLTEPLNCW